MRNGKGYTLIELMVAMVIATIVMAAIYSVYRIQTKQHRTQQKVVQMQENMRAAMYLLEREIRMAGYSAADPPAAAGFVANFSGLTGVVGDHATSGAATDAHNIAFTSDDDNSGAIEDTTSFEIMAYRLNDADKTLERWSLVDPAGPDWDWQVVAEQIISLSFTYYREGSPGNPPAPLSFPINAADMPNIRQVKVAITATAGDRTMNLTNVIKCRNLGY